MIAKAAAVFFCLSAILAGQNGKPEEPKTTAVEIKVLEESPKGSKYNLVIFRFDPPIPLPASVGDSELRNEVWKIKGVNYPVPEKEDSTGLLTGFRFDHERQRKFYFAGKRFILLPEKNHISLQRAIDGVIRRLKRLLKTPIKRKALAKR